jgi:hypothetical protein
MTVTMILVRLRRARRQVRTIPARLRSRNRGTSYDEA